MIACHAIVRAVESRSRQVHVSGHNKEAVFRDESIGWYIVFDGNWSMCVGHERPDVTAGDLVIIRISKETPDAR